MNTPKEHGLPDRPGARDLLKLEKYTNGIAAFIKSCGTPLTLAVQGDWGAGKTSTMLLVEEALCPDAQLTEISPQKTSDRTHRKTVASAPLYTISFNTWQYAQFEMDGMLAISMMKAIVNDLEKILPPAAEGSALARSKKTLAILGNVFVNGVTNLTFGGSVGQVFPFGGASQGDGPTSDVVTMIGELRKTLSSLVDEAVTSPDSDEKGRVVIFIDDLDRLDPIRAVELMEALKVFLDLDNCVFVLAIDFDVVAQGIQSKYGKDALSSKKARSFFDKIIQVPFHMPTSSYDTSKLLDEAYASAGLSLSKDQKDAFQELVQNSVNNNPRAIKRLMNTFMLLQNISQYPNADLSRIFSILCIQLAYPGLYADLSNHVFAETLTQFFLGSAKVREVRGKLEELFEVEDDILRKEEIDMLLEHWGINTIVEQQALQSLALTISKVFEGSDSEKFRVYVDLSAITGVNATRSDAASSNYRWGHKFYSVEERENEWRDRFANEPKLRQTHALAEQFVSRLANIQLPGGYGFRVGMQAGNSRNWTIECGGKRVGIMDVNQKFFHVYFGPRAWMVWNNDPVEDDPVTKSNKYCKKTVEDSHAVSQLAEKWEHLFTEELDIESSLSQG